MYQLDFYYSRVGFSFSFGLLIILCICTVYSAILFPTLFDNFSKLKTRLKQTWEIGWLTRQLIADFGNLTQKYSTSTDFTSHSINMVSTKHAVVSMYADPAIDQTNQKGRRYRKVRNCELPLFWRYSNSCLSFGSVMVPLCESRLKRYVNSRSRSYISLTVLFVDGDHPARPIHLHVLREGADYHPDTLVLIADAGIC